MQLSPHEDDADYPPNFVANLATQVAQLEEDVKGIWGTPIEYPDVEAPPPSPPGH